MFDLQSGELLPRLGDYDEDELGYASDEQIAAVGEQYRLEHIREMADKQAARAKAAYLHQHIAPSNPADERAPKTKPIPEVGLPPEPRRIPGQPPPQWNSRRGCWEPAHIYHYPQRRLRQKIATEKLMAGDKRWGDPDFAGSAEAERLLDEAIHGRGFVLPSLRRSR
jgi:hypothetical protein